MQAASRARDPPRRTSGAAARIVRLGLAFARSARWPLAGAAALMIAGSLIEGVGLILLVPFIGLITGRGIAPASGRLATAVEALTQAIAPLSPILVLLALYGGLVVARAVIVVARDLTLTRLHLGFIERLRLGLAARLARAPWSRVSRVSHARVTHALGFEVERCGAAVQALIQLAVSLILVLVLTAAALAISPALTALTVAILALSVLALWPAFASARAQGVAVGAAGAALVESSSDFLGGLKLTASHGLAAGFIASYRDLSAALGASRYAFVALRSRATALANLIFAAAAAGLVAAGAGPLRLEPALLLAFLILAARLAGPAAQAQRALLEVLGDSTAHEDLLALEADLGGEDSQDAPQPAAPAPAGAIVVAAVTYLHPGGRGVRGIDLTLEHGAFVGLAGASGAGKTTLADLLAGLIEPQAGEIRVAGVPLLGQVRTAWRASLAYVPQDPFLFSVSLRENLAWAAPDAADDELWRALALAEAEALVRALPDGLNSRAGERGGLISGGERQRIALARALLRRPRLLILDEALSAVDAPAERRILARLAALAQRPTIMMITHRTESLALCDRVVGLHEGAVAQEPDPLARNRCGR